MSVTYLPQEAPKSMPHAAAIKSLYNLSGHGSTSPVTDQLPFELDLQDNSDIDTYHEGLAFFEIMTTNGQGGTPTSPGAAVTWTLSYAFVNFQLTDETVDPPIVLADLASTFQITLPDTALSTAAGQRIFQSGTPFIIQGRYLYCWFDADAFATNAQINLHAKIIRV